MHTATHLLWGVSKHVSVAYLAYSLIRHRRGRRPTGALVGVVLLGAVFPDLVDKPLVVLGVVEYGRSAAHSLLSASAVLVVLWKLGEGAGRSEATVAFATGYLSHVVVDMYGPLLTGSQSMDTAFLLWPVVVEYPLGVPTPSLPVGRGALFGTLMLCSVCLWVYDGLPILSTLVRLPRAWVEAFDRRSGP